MKILKFIPLTSSTAKVLLQLLLLLGVVTNPVIAFAYSWISLLSDTVDVIRNIRQLIKDTRKTEA